MVKIISVMDPHKYDQEAMLAALDAAREKVESGRIRSLFMVVAPRDPDGEMTQWDIGAGTFAEMIGWLEQLKMRLLLRCFDIAQNE